VRRVVSIVAVLAVATLVATPPLAAGLSSPNSQSVDIDIAFQGLNQNLDFVDEAGNVGSIGPNVDDVGGVGDINDDGDLEIAFVNGNNVKFTDQNGNVVNTGADGFAVGGVADINGDGDTEIAFLDTNQNIKFVDATGNTVDTGADGNVFARIGGVADIDGDGDLDITYADSNDNLDYVDADGNVATTGASASGLGGIADIDGDGDLDVVFSSTGSSNIKFVDATGNTVDTGVVSLQVGGVGDINDDGDLEIAFVDGNDNVKFTDQNGNVVNTGADGFAVGGVADINGDGLFTASPSLDNSSASPDGTTVTSGSVSLSIPVNDPELDDGDSVTVDVTLNGQQVGSKTITSNQTVSFSAKPQDGSNSWSVTATDAAGNSVTSQTFSFTGEFAAPRGSDPSPAGKITSYDGAVKLAVNDSDFALAAGDTVTVEAANATGGTIGSTTISSNQSVSFSYAAKAGPNDITWTLTDSYGEAATVNQRFSTPAEIRVENASAPGTLITGSSNTITVSFFDESDTVFRRTTTDGTVNLSGLPAAPEQGYQVNVEDGTDFNSRQVVVDSLFEQQTVFLLPAGADTATVEFILDDKTGQFDPETTTLILERPINASGNTTFKSVFASEVGAGGSQRVVLENGQRYRIRVRNTQGRERALGSFDVSGSDVVTLDIGQLSFAVADSPQTFNVSADTTVSNGTVDSAQFKFRDPTDQTSEVRVDFVGANNTTLASASSSTQPVTQFAFTQQFSQNVTASDLRIAYEIDRSGETTSGVLRAGASQFSPGIPLKPGLKQLFAVGLIIMVGGLFSQTNAAAGAVVTPLFAAGLWFIDWLPPGVTILGIALALGVGVLVNIKTRP
jgi:hypothetical protein